LEKYGYIYCTTDLKNGIKYIGQKKSSIFISDYKGSGIIISRKLKSRPNDFRVDLIEWCYSCEELNKCEYDWTVAVGLHPLSYNLKYGGNGLSGYNHTEETKQKQRHSNKTKLLWQDEEYRKMMKESQTGRKASEDTKRKMSEARIGKKHKEHKKSKKYCYSDEAKMKMRESKKGEKNPMFGKIPWNKGLKNIKLNNIV